MAGFKLIQLLGKGMLAIASIVIAINFVFMAGCGRSGGSPVGGSAGGDSPGVSVSERSLLALFAGYAGGAGNNDGTGVIASFNFPTSVAVDGRGNIYVADKWNSTIRKITPLGEVTTLAGKAGVIGNTDGAGAAASFNCPSGVGVDCWGNVYVADTGNHTIRKITPVGMVTTLAGTAGVSGHADGAGAVASFNFPSGIAADASGNVYVVDTNNYTIRKITPLGVVTTLAGTAGVVGHADGTGSAASFNYPYAAAVDGMGNVYVADTFNYTIRKINPLGVVTTLAGTAGVMGHADGTGSAASFGVPYGVTVDGTGNVYVADSNNRTIRKITTLGVVTTMAGTAGVVGHADGTGAAASFNVPYGVAVDGTGNVYVADTFNDTIRKITTLGVVTTVAGTAWVNGYLDGTGASASFGIPNGVTVDGTGNVYVADSYNSTIRKITPAGVVNTLAGTAGISGHMDGTGAAASFNYPSGVAADDTGNVYVADTMNSTIRKITPVGVVTTLAGTAGVSGHMDGTGAAASFNHPSGVAVDDTGNVYVADTMNSTIRKITPVGVVTTLAGTAGVSGHMDGTGAAASFNYPSGVAVDDTGNVYVADTGNNIIRKITPVGVVTTLAGTAGVSGHTDGIGTSASFNGPWNLAVDGSGNVYVADNMNSTIRKITPLGVVTTVVGQVGVVGFEPGDLPGVLAYPFGIAVFGTTLYTTTYNAIVKVTPLP